MSTRDDKLQRRHFRNEAFENASHPKNPEKGPNCETETADPKHPLRVLTDGKGGPHNWRPYSNGQNGEKIYIEKEPGVYTDGDQPAYVSLAQDAGHMTSYKPRTANFLALEASGPNRQDGGRGERHDKEAVIVDGKSAGQEVPIHRDTLGGLVEKGLVPQRILDASRPSAGWQIDMGVTELANGDPARNPSPSAHQAAALEDSLTSHETSLNTMHTQTQNQATEEQARRSREIAEQNQIDLSQVSFSPVPQENQTHEQARQPATELEPAPEVGQLPDKAATGQAPELENQPAGSMDVNRASQSDLTLAAAGNGGDGNDSSKPINLAHENFGDESSAVRDDYLSRQTVEQSATELEPAPVVGQQQDQATTELEPAPVVGQQQDQAATELEPAPVVGQQQEQAATELEPAPVAGQQQDQATTELEPAPEAGQQQDQPATDLEPAPEAGQHQDQPVTELEPAPEATPAAQPVQDQTQDYQR